VAATSQVKAGCYPSRPGHVRGQVPETGRSTGQQLVTLWCGARRPRTDTVTRSGRRCLWPCLVSWFRYPKSENAACFPGGKRSGRRLVPRRARALLVIWAGCVDYRIRRCSRRHVAPRSTACTAGCCVAFPAGSVLIELLGVTRRVLRQDAYHERQ
jgi:hypothetical protein